MHSTLHSTLHSNHPLDLLSNPLTYIYFSLVDQYMHLIKSSSKPTKAFMRTLQSFLFLYETNPNNLKKLNALVFSEFIPYESIPSSQLYRLESTIFPLGAKYFASCKYKLSFPILYKVYAKQFLKLKKLHDLHEIGYLNQSFIHLHQRLIYASFPTQENLPPLLKVTNANLFLDEALKLIDEIRPS